MQAGYKRCLFFISTASVIKELCSVFMVREYLRVPLLMFWLETNSKDLHKIFQKANVCIVKDKHSNSNILGRCAYNGSNNGRNSHVQRHCNLPYAIFGFCFKPGEIHFESNDFEDVSVFTTREGVKNLESIPGC